jgi:hypothetical protein
MTHPDHLKDTEAEHLAKILGRSPELLSCGVPSFGVGRGWLGRT